MTDTDLFGQAVPRQRNDDWPDDFEIQFWCECPRKVGHLVAMKALAKVRKNKLATFAQVMAGVKRWAKSVAKTDPQFIKHPATWLNSGGWQDEIEAPGPKSNTAAYVEDWKIRADRQMADRIEWQAPRPPSMKIARWLNGSDPVKAQLEGHREAQESERARIAEEAKNRAVRARLAEYAAAGLEPVYADKNREIPLSFPFLLANGWTVEETPEGKVLVGPKGREGS